MHGAYFPLYSMSSLVGTVPATGYKYQVDVRWWHRTTLKPIGKCPVDPISLGQEVCLRLLGSVCSVRLSQLFAWTTQDANLTRAALGDLEAWIAAHFFEPSVKGSYATSQGNLQLFRMLPRDKFKIEIMRNERWIEMLRKLAKQPRNMGGTPFKQDKQAEDSDTELDSDSECECALCASLGVHSCR